MVSPAGLGTEENWRALVGGHRFLQAIDDPKITGGGVACAGSIRGFEPPAGSADWDRVSQLAIAAADQAVAAADLYGHKCRPADVTRMHISFGTSKGGVLSFSRMIQALATLPITSSRRYLPLDRGHDRPAGEELIRGNNASIGGRENYLPEPARRSQYLRLLLDEVPPDAPARRLAARFGASQIHATVAACATGTLAVIRGIQAILDGQAEIVLAGSSDASLQPLWFAAFRQMGVLAEPHPSLGPEWAGRPFDRTRGGFAISEGAAVLVLESSASVRRRGIQPLTRISGYATGADPAGLAQLEPSGTPLVQVAKIACDRAGVAPARLAAIQAHGTGTITNDQVEINAIRGLCGPCAHQVPVFSIKGTLGHLLGAAGSVELAIAAQAVANRVIPPNATLIEPDPAWSSFSLPRTAMQIPPGPILKTSMGFGGHLAAVILEPA